MPDSRTLSSAPTVAARVNFSRSYAPKHNPLSLYLTWILSKVSMGKTTWCAHVARLAPVLLAGSPNQYLLLPTAQWSKRTQIVLLLQKSKMKAIQIYLLLFSNGFQCIIYLINKLITFAQSCSTSTTTNSGPRPRGTIQLSPWLFWYACSCYLIKL